MKKSDPNLIFKQPLKVINLGVATFRENLEKQGIQVLQVDWRPPAGGDEKLLEILDKLS